jgi:hypothetical protein
MKFYRERGNHGNKYGVKGDYRRGKYMDREKLGYSGGRERDRRVEEKMGYGERRGYFSPRRDRDPRFTDRGPDGEVGK